MKPTLRMGVVAVALLSTVGVAAAAGASQGSLPNASTSQASDSVTLSSAQKKTIWQDVSQLNATKSSAPAGFDAKVGAKLPASVMLHPLPTKVTNSIAATRPYEYAMLDRQLLIVNPMDKKIVDVITQSG